MHYVQNKNNRTSRNENPTDLIRKVKDLYKVDEAGKVQKIGKVEDVQSCTRLR